MNERDRVTIETDGEAAGRLLDRQAPSDYVQEWTARVAAEKAASEAETQNIFIFRAGTEWLALPADALLEVGERSTIHALPHRQGGALRGLTSVRGELLLCISIETLLGLEKTGEDDEEVPRATARMLVVAQGSERVAVPVSHVHGMHRYHPQEIRAVPTTLIPAGSYMTGVLPWSDRIVGCLDVHRLFLGLNGALS